MSKAALIVGVVGVVALVAAILLHQHPAPETDRTTDRAVAPKDDVVDSRRRERDLTRKVALFEERLQALEAAAMEKKRSDAEAGLVQALEFPSPELDALIAEAVHRARQGGGPDAEAAKRKKLDAMNKKAAAAAGKFTQYLHDQLDTWISGYGLSAGQIDQLKRVATDSVTRQTQAKLDGVSGRDLVAIQVETQAEVRRIVGDDVYTATERDRTNRERRGKLMWMSTAVGGLSDQQHAELDRALESAVERDLPHIIRLRSVPQSDEEYDETARRVSEGAVGTWNRVRDEILTDEQRRRIPGK